MQAINPLTECPPFAKILGRLGMAQDEYPSGTGNTSTLCSGAIIVVLPPEMIKTTEKQISNSYSMSVDSNDRNKKSETISYISARES